MSKKELPAVVNLSIFTLITVLVWTGFEVYQVLTDDAAPIVSPDTLRELPADLDESVFNRLQQSVYMDEQAIGDTVLTDTVGILETPAPTNVPEASPVPEVTSAPEGEGNE